MSTYRITYRDRGIKQSITVRSYGRAQDALTAFTAGYRTGITDVRITRLACPCTSMEPAIIL